MNQSSATYPLVYSCSGCSGAAQLANALALALSRAGRAEMSCIVGVGGDVAPLVRLARSGRPVLALDGCHLACVKACLAQRQVSPTIHLVLAELGVKKMPQQAYSRADFDVLWPEICRQAESLANRQVA